MAQLGDTIILGNLSTTGTIYGNLSGTATNATCFGGCTYADACADIRSGLTDCVGTVTILDAPKANSNVPIALCTGDTSIGKSASCGLNFNTCTGLLSTTIMTASSYMCTGSYVRSPLFMSLGTSGASAVNNVTIRACCTNASCTLTCYNWLFCGSTGYMHGNVCGVLKGSNIYSNSPSTSTSCCITLRACCCNASAITCSDYIFSATAFTANKTMTNCFSQYKNNFFVGCCFCKADNSGYPTIRLIADVTNWWDYCGTSSSISAIGMLGDIYVERISGYMNCDIGKIAVYANYRRDQTSPTGISAAGTLGLHYQVHFGSNYICPMMLCDTTNNKKYIALKLMGSGKAYTFNGFVNGSILLNTCPELCYTSSTALPTGWTEIISGSVTPTSTMRVSYASTTCCACYVCRGTNNSCLPVLLAGGTSASGGGATYISATCPITYTGSTGVLCTCCGVFDLYLRTQCLYSRVPDNGQCTCVTILARCKDNGGNQTTWCYYFEPNGFFDTPYIRMGRGCTNESAGLIRAYGNKSTNDMICFLNNTNDANGNGYSIGGGGVGILGAGESACNAWCLINGSVNKYGACAGKENLYLTSDGCIVFWSNMNTPANKCESYISTDGYYHGNVCGNLCGFSQYVTKNAFSSASTLWDVPLWTSDATNTCLGANSKLQFCLDTNNCGHLITDCFEGKVTTSDTANNIIAYSDCASGCIVKCATLNGFSLENGQRILFYLANRNCVANACLNVNGTGDKAIKINGTTSVTASNLSNGYYMANYVVNSNVGCWYLYPILNLNSSLTFNGTCNAITTNANFGAIGVKAWYITCNFGYMMFVNRLLVQWGAVTPTYYGDDYYTISLPLSYATTCYTILALADTMGGGPSYGRYVSSSYRTKQSFRWSWLFDQNLSRGFPLNYLTIGYAD